MRYTPFTGFGIDFGPLVILTVALAGFFVWLRHVRHSGWTPILWLPIAVVSGVSSIRLLSAFFEPRLSGLEGMVAALGRHYDLMSGWPWIVMFATAVWAHPRRWRSFPTAAGLVLAAIPFVISYRSATQPLVVEVLDPDGAPKTKFTLTGSGTRDGKTVSFGHFTTDEHGRFNFRFDPETGIRLTSETSDKFYSSEIQIHPATNLSSSGTKTDLRIEISWWLRDNIGVPHGTKYWARPTKEVPIVLFLKSRDRVINPLLQDRIRGTILEVRKTGARDALIGTCGNPESLALIGDIADIITAQPTLRDHVIGELEHVASVLHSIDDLHDSLLPKRHIYGWHPDDQQNYEALCRWAEVPPSKPLQTQSAIERKIRGYADLLIERSRPYWTDEHHSVHVVERLERLGKPAIAMFPQAILQAHPRAQAELVHALWYFAPTVEDVEWFISNDDPDFVIAGYHATETRIKPDEM